MCFLYSVRQTLFRSKFKHFLKTPAELLLRQSMTAQQHIINKIIASRLIVDSHKKPQKYESKNDVQSNTAITNNVTANISRRPRSLQICRFFLPAVWLRCYVTFYSNWTKFKYFFYHTSSLKSLSDAIVRSRSTVKQINILRYFVLVNR